LPFIGVPRLLSPTGHRAWEARRNDDAASPRQAGASEDPRSLRFAYATATSISAASTSASAKRAPRETSLSRRLSASICGIPAYESAAPAHGSRALQPHLRSEPPKAVRGRPRRHSAERELQRVELDLIRKVQAGS